MVGYRKKSRFTLIPAEVIAQKQATTSRNIIVGTGVLAGVKKDMPVISTEGVVGKIIEAYPFHANVQLINDPFARTGVSINRLNVPGILECKIHKAPAVRVFLHHEIQKGDTIVTSGLGGIFPKGLFVGTIVNILPGDDLFKIAEIELNPGLQEIDNTFIMNIKTQWQPFPEEQKK
jgi:rod shape-determining protein MreC